MLLPARDLEADTAEIEVSPPTEAMTARSHDPAPAPGMPLPWPLIWMATTFLVIAALTIVVIATADGDGGAPMADEASGPIASVPTTGASTTTASTAAGAARGSNPVPETPATPLAAACADLDSQHQALGSQRHQAQEIHRHDHDTREELKHQLGDQQQAVAAQTRELGC